MEVRKGYKQTEVGIIPEDWDVKLIDDLAEKVMVGIASAATHAYRPQGIPLLRNQNIKKNYLQDDDLLFIDEQYELIYKNKRLKTGDLLTARTGYPGTTCIIPPKYDGAQCFTTIITRLKKNEINSDYLCHYINSEYGISFIEKSKIGGGQKNIGVGIFQGMPIPIPSPAEQEAIAEALSDADALIESLETLLAKKRQVKQGVMSELLTGKRRLPGFSGKWEEKRIEEIAYPSSEKNKEAESLPVLTCSKHLGFVDSLGYFKNQVFSRDTSGYKIIYRGQIGYPSNHVEEGSIGLQDLYDVAIVSPIYVVFSVTENINSYFLHRLLKLDEYRQKFDTATTASVDRRGSLRWPAFSKIIVNLPELSEQTAIAEILSDMDAEIRAVEGKLSKARVVKAGMMSELLTGRTRLV